MKKSILWEMWRAIRTNSLQRKLVICVTAVICALIGVSMLFSGIYFSQMMENRIMRDYTELLRYSSGQIGSFYEEIRQQATIMAADENLQELLSRDYQPANIMRKKYRINEILRPYVMLDSNLISAEVETGDGTVYTSEQANRMITREDGEEWLGTLSEDREGFSREHEIYYARYARRVISYVLPINNYYDNTSRSALLFLNIPYDKFVAKIKGNLQDLNWIVLQAANGAVIYSESTDGLDENILQTRIQEVMREGSSARDNTHEIILQNPVSSGDMTLTISLTDANIVHEVRTVYVFFVRLFFVALLVAIVGVCLATLRVTASIRKVTEAAREIAGGNKDVYVNISGNDEVRVLADVFNDMAANVNQQMKQIQEAEKEKNQLKMDILMAQINPHFIYNTLNSAIYLCQLKENDRAVRLIRAFVQLLQDNMKSGVEGMIAEIGEEEACIKNYLEIQSIRYPGRFVSVVEVDEDIRELHIPRLILQPFVENSLNHGILTEENPGEIWISVKKEKDRLHILIRDNGAGMDAETLERVRRFEKKKQFGRVRSVGISNVNERLKLMYRDNYRLNILSNESEGGMTVEILLPLYFDQDFL